MKKYILLTALILALLLQGCQFNDPTLTGPKNTTTSQPPPDDHHRSAGNDGSADHDYSTGNNRPANHSAA